ncbi:MAG TPA: hypothetical protein VFM29_01530 [Vicinamibacteria bacterium]|nr:hypothetical protein [Vicinamibacteria bacterium]
MDAESRRTPWEESGPRQRRLGPWPADEPRQRRRTRWAEFRGAYPRIVTAMSLGVVALVLLDAVLLVKRHQYRTEDQAARRLMSAMERQQADALVASAAGRTQLAMPWRARSR